MQIISIPVNTLSCHSANSQYNSKAHCRYTDANIGSRHFLEECSAVDPRFKGLTWLTSSEKDTVFQRIIDKVVAEEILASSIKDRDTPSCSFKSDPVTYTSEDPLPKSAKRYLL